MALNISKSLHPNPNSYFNNFLTKWRFSKKKDIPLDFFAIKRYLEQIFTQKQWTNITVNILAF